MSVRDDQHVYVTQSEKLERIQRSHARLLAAAKGYLYASFPEIPPRLDELQAAIEAAEELTQ